MFGRRHSRNGNRPVDLDEIIAQFGQAAGFWPTQPEAMILAQARLADVCRDVEVRPVPPSHFQHTWESLEDESRLRFCIMFGAFEIDAVKLRLPVLCNEAADASPAVTLLLGLSERLELLTAEMIQQSDVRLEEFSRHFCAAFALTIKDENTAKSADRLHEIDFGRLMKEADAARSSAEERMAYLRKLQEEQEETRRPRRGKW